MRKLENMVRLEKITYSRMVEMLNEKASEPEGLWATGYVKCDLCTHEWVAVRPSETKELECPNCQTLGAFTTPEDGGFING